jgi:hypothetical protein
LDKWVKIIGIVGGVLGFGLTAISIWNLLLQRELSKTQHEVLQYQVEDAKAKQRLNIGLELITTRARGNAVNISLRVSNYSARPVGIAMIGIRIWKNNWRSADDTLKSHPELLILAVNRVVDCPASICPKETSKSKLENTQHQLLLGPGPGGPLTESFGTFPVSQDDLQRGVWIQGIAYTVEGIKEKCTVAGSPVVDGAFPIYCEESRKFEDKCYERAECGFEVIAQPFPNSR